MRIPKLALAGYLVGVFLIIAAFIRYTFVFDDPYKLAVFGGIGFIVLALSYLYAWMKNKDIDDKKRDSRIDAIVAWWMKSEKADVIARAIGKED